MIEFFVNGLHWGVAALGFITPFAVAVFVIIYVTGALVNADKRRKERNDTDS